MEPDQKTAYIMLGSILSDTVDLKTDTTTFAGREAVRALSKLAGVSDTDAMYKEMYKASISYDGMTDEEIFFSDYKEYEYAGFKYSIGCINAYDEQDAADLVERIREITSATPSKRGLDMAFAQISIFHDDLSITYIVPSDEKSADIINTAFRDTATYDGVSFRLEPGISRRQVLVPAINYELDKNKNSQN